MFINCKGVPYHVTVKGEGEPLLFLHGFTGSHETWEKYADLLAEHCMCIIPDLLGHGKTACPPEPTRYGVEEACKDLKNILEFLQIEKVNIIGYSMGGRLGLSFALAYPELVKSLMLESSSPGLKTVEERQARIKQDCALAERILSEGVLPFTDYWEEIPLFHSQKRLPYEKRRKIRKQRLLNSEVGLANSLKGMGTGVQPSYWDRLHELDMPVLLVTGEYDKKFCRIAENMKNRIPNSEWIVAEKTGHAIHVEDYELFGKIIREFVDKRREKRNGY